NGAARRAVADRAEIARKGPTCSDTGMRSSSVRTPSRERGRCGSRRDKEFLRRFRRYRNQVERLVNIGEQSCLVRRSGAAPPAGSYLVLEGARLPCAVGDPYPRLSAGAGGLVKWVRDRRREASRPGGNCTPRFRNSPLSHANDRQRRNRWVDG